MVIDEVTNKNLLDAAAVFGSESSTLGELAKAYNNLLVSHNEGELSLEQIQEKRKELRIVLETRFSLFNQQFHNGDKSPEFLDEFVLLIRMLSIAKFQIQLSISEDRAEDLVEYSLIDRISTQIEKCSTDNSFLSLFDLAHMLLKLKGLVTTEQ